MIWRTFFHYKAPLVIPRMVTILHGSINDNKEPLIFERVEEPFLVPLKTLSNQFFKEPLYAWFEEHFNDLKNVFPL